MGASAGAKGALRRYQAKRDFSVTPEPGAALADTGEGLGFVVQKHHARRLHYDFRLELDGVMKSWAVPKGPSLDPADKRMAIEVEDHPVAYASFEGTIPPKQYGAGEVVVWDKGQWRPRGDPRKGLRSGNLKFDLSGHKLRGGWALVRMKGGDEKKPAWLLIKERDDFARPADEFDVLEAGPGSVSALGQPAPAGWPAAAVAADLPDALSPQLAVRVEALPPDDGEWLYELKFDGYRLLACIDARGVRLITRGGLDWTHRLKPLCRDLAGMNLPPGWYDGELVAFNDRGLPDFGVLQQTLERARPGELVLYLFDLPHAGGHDLRAAPLQERRALLERLLGPTPPDSVRLSAALEVPGRDVLASACRLGLEGVIAKRKDAPYRSRRSDDWLKIKCGLRQEFVIGGFTEGQGTRAGFGSLMLGVYDGQGALRHVGNVGSGFDGRTLARLHRQLKALERATPAFADATRPPTRPHWVEPRLVAEVAFAAWTHGGHIRQGVFVGLREDKEAREVTREIPKPTDPPAPVPQPTEPVVPAQPPTAGAARLRVTNPQRVIDRRSGLTKLDLVRHYEAVGELMMVHLRERPVALLRAPRGIAGQRFFQKHLEAELPGIAQLDPALSPGHAPWIAVASERGLLSAAQWNVVEVHTQNASHRRFEQPNRLVFDLDPGEGVAWHRVQESAQLMQALLDQLGLVGYLKTSGGKGLHVVVPLRPQHGWDTVKGFSKAVVQHMARTLPDRFVAKSGPKNRVGKVFVDYLRNGRGATTVSAWSARARPGMGVSVPVHWSELDALKGGDHWTVRNVHERLATGNEPWGDYARRARTLTAAMKRLGYSPENT